MPTSCADCPALDALTIPVPDLTSERKRWITAGVRLSLRPLHLMTMHARVRRSRLMKRRITAGVSCSLGPPHQVWTSKSSAWLRAYPLTLCFPKHFMLSALKSAAPKSVQAPGPLQRALTAEVLESHCLRQCVAIPSRTCGGFRLISFKFWGNASIVFVCACRELQTCFADGKLFSRARHRKSATAWSDSSTIGLTQK